MIRASRAPALAVGFGTLMAIGTPRAAGAQTFSNTSAITIPASGTAGPAAPYPSTIAVSGVSGPVGKLTVKLTGLSHTYYGDLDLLLVGPTGTKLILFSDVGATFTTSGAGPVTITLDDGAASQLPATGQLSSGVYRPTDNLPADTFPAPAPSIAAGDHAAPSGSATLASQFGGIDPNGTWSLYVVDDVSGDTGVINGGWSITFPPPPAAAGALLISEFRLRGTGGSEAESAANEFIEIYNASGADHIVSSLSGTGYGVAASDGVTRCTIPNGTVLPNRGHYLCVNSVGYSLAPYAVGDATYTTNIPDNAGIAIFNNNVGGSSYSLANRLDAVGSTSEADSLYREGSGYPPLATYALESAWTRRPLGGCTGSASGNCASQALMRSVGPVVTSALSDANDNAADFILVDTAATNAGAGQRLGAPGPENLSAPRIRDGSVTVTSSKLDTCSALERAPNAVRDVTSDAPNNSYLGTLDIRRTITNKTGSNITRLRFRIVDISTFPSMVGVADLRPRTSAPLAVTVDRSPCGSGTSNVTVQGTTLEQPPSQFYGGGYNSSMSVGAITPGTPLANNASIDVRFLLGVEQAGVARFCVVPEVLPDGVGEPFCYIGDTDVPSVYAPGDFDNDSVADVVLYNRGTGMWSVDRSGLGYAIGLNWGGADYVPVPGDYDGDKRGDAALYRESTGQWSVLLSGGNFTRVLSINWGGPGYEAMPGDYDGDGQTDLAVYYTPTGYWYILLSSSGYTTSRTVSWGGPGYTAVGGLDFDGDRKSDLTIYNERLARWYVLQSSTNFTTGFTQLWGGWNGPGYTIVAGDYDGDRKADFALYERRTGLWFILLSSTGYTSSLTVSLGGPGSLPTPGDYDGDGRIDPAVYQRQTTKFTALTSSTFYASTIVKTFGTANDVPLSTAVLPRGSRELHAGDFDGDASSDLTVYNTTTGVWSILKSSSGFTTASNIGWGGSGYTAVPGDYDGDGRYDLGLYQGATGNWLVLLSASNYTTTLTKGAGGTGYIPVPGDYDGDGKTDLVVYNTTTGLWYGLKSSTNYTTTINVSWGGTGYTAVPGDYDGDGKQDLGLYQESTGTWLILTSSSNYASMISRNFGGAGYAPVQADYDGDGITDFAVYQASTGIWTMLKSSTANTIGFTVSYGGAGYMPVAGDWDGDGCADVGVYTAAGVWSILLSGGNYTTSLAKSWGGAGYVPVPQFP